MIHDSMPYDPIQVKVKVTGLKCAKWQISKAISEICIYAPTQYLNFKWIDF